MIPKEPPVQYKRRIDELIRELMSTVRILYPFISELGERLEIKGDKCTVIVIADEEDE
jgi:hypothetical protein